MGVDFALAASIKSYINCRLAGVAVLDANTPFTISLADGLITAG